MSNSQATLQETQPLKSLNVRPGDVLYTATYTLETSRERKRRKYSLWIMYYTTLLQSIGGSIVITGMWPYLQQLDATVEKEWLGWVVAANPLGQLIFSPIIGWWCNRINSVRSPSLFCLILFIGSSCWYGLLPLHDKGAVWLICVARFLVGVSSGSITACRTFITQGTLLGERTQAISHLSLSQALGFVLGPVGQLVLKPLGSEGITIIQDRLSLNMYTAVGWLTALLGLTNLMLFHPKIFHECDIAQREAQMKAKLTAAQTPQSLNRWTNTTPDYLGILVIIITFFIVFFNFVLLETLGTPVSIDQFGWSHSTAITNVGLTMIISSVVSTSIFFLIPYLARKIDERVLLLGFGIFPMIIGRLFFFPFSGDSPPMREFGCVDAKTGQILQNMTVQADCHKDNSSGGSYNWIVVQHGCPPSQTWCFEMPALNPLIVAIGYGICTLGFPFCIALSQTIFSKMIGPRPQGVWMGAMTSVSSLSRVIGPIFVTFIYTKYGTIVTSATATALMIFSFLLLAVVYKRLIPLVDNSRRQSSDSNHNSPSK